MVADLWLIVLIGSVIFLGLVWGILDRITRHPEWPRERADESVAHRCDGRAPAARGRDG